LKLNTASINDLEEMFKQWRVEIDAVDAELVFLLNRRVQLAVEMLHILRSEMMTLGDAVQDGDRLSIILSWEPTVIFKPLDTWAVKKIYRRIVRESRRMAEASGKAKVANSDKPK
jgi:chorismate mutase